ncbi:hypothetical protein ABES25_09825 [Bacillus gobiensis]|uniref:hypothetical protein n=1 Tax=Bacillus gobiensis TaxID=1441095 RepID=UPI003D1ACAA9
MKKARINHFVEMQKKYGTPGGEFARSQKNDHCFPVLTGWINVNTHEKYMADNFPDLIKTATPKQDVIQLTGQQFIVEESWRVCP